MAEIFNVNDAVAVAWFFKFMEERVTDISSSKVAKEWARFFENYMKEHAEGKIKIEDRFIQANKDVMAAMLKLANETTYDKIADINDDSGPNDVEVEDLIKGFIRKDVYEKMGREPTTKGKMFTRMQMRCPLGFKTLQMALKIKDKSAKYNMTQNAYDNCRLENKGKPLNKEEKKELDDIVAYHGIHLMFHGRDYYVKEYDIGKVYGTEGEKYFRERHSAMVKEIENRPTLIPQFMIPYFIDVTK